MKAIIVHGGMEDTDLAPEIKGKRYAGTKQACEVGYEALQKTDSALEAVIAAVHHLEDDPIFDAGTGSFYNLFGEIEMDASIMDSTGNAGAVACIQHVQHPISAARLVMEETPHVLMVGRGAELFARSYGFPEYDPGTDYARGLLEEQLGKVPERMRQLMERYEEIRKKHRSYSTVGAVAIDSSGLIVAGTSTGGIPQKLPGRVGDTPIIGAGTFAAVEGGASATGYGEGIIKLGATRAVVEKLARGLAVQEACQEIVTQGTKAKALFAVIALDKDGNPGAHFNGTLLPAYYRSEQLSEAVPADGSEQ